MSDKKYTITLTLDELYHVKEALNNRNMHYENDFVEMAEKEEDIEYEKKQEKIMEKLTKRINKKWSKLFN